MMTTLSSLFAGLATLLAAVGLYGVLAYTVSQRTREIGLRMALGAAPGSVRAMVLRQVAWMTLIGGIIGLAGAVGVGYSAASILFELKAWDPAVLTISAVLLTIVATRGRPRPGPPRVASGPDDRAAIRVGANRVIPDPLIAHPESLIVESRIPDRDPIPDRVVRAGRDSGYQSDSWISDQGSGIRSEGRDECLDLLEDFAGIADDQVVCA